MSELLSFMFSIAFFRLLTPPPLNITQATARKSKFYGGATQQPRFFQSSSSEATEVFGLIAKWFQHNQFFPLSVHTLQTFLSQRAALYFAISTNCVLSQEYIADFAQTHSYLARYMASSERKKNAKVALLFVECILSIRQNKKNGNFVYFLKLLIRF